jgi:cob(I)alamin adenosyltransferase
MEGQYDAPDATHLETATERLNAQLPPLTEFVLPGGGQAAAQAHVCRSVCRRAEVDLWSLNDRPDPNANLVRAAQYLNRLSDYFFVLARTLTQTAEQQWSGPKR